MGLTTDEVRFYEVDETEVLCLRRKIPRRCVRALLDRGGKIQIVRPTRLAAKTILFEPSFSMYYTVEQSGEPRCQKNGSEAKGAISVTGRGSHNHTGALRDSLRQANKLRSNEVRKTGDESHPFNKYKDLPSTRGLQGNCTPSKQIRVVS